MRGLRQIVFIATKDFLLEARLSICAVAGLAAVITPLLVLFGLKYGIVSTMIDRLETAPTTRQIKPLGQGRYSMDWLEDLTQRPEAAFVVPATRFLSATIRMRPAEASRVVPLDVEMLPTAPDDPLWSGQSSQSSRGGGERVEVVVSAPLAERLGLSRGDHVSGRIGRIVDGRRESETIALSVVGVMPLRNAQRNVALVPLQFLLDTEDYREGYAVPDRGWAGMKKPTGERFFASFRLYARTIDDVIPLRDLLAQQGVDTETAAEQISIVQTINEALTTLFVIIVTLAVVGYGFSMMLGLIATVARKQAELSCLKVLGFSNIDVAAFPVVQALLTASLGSGAAVGLYFIVEPTINRLFRDSLPDGGMVCRILPEHLMVAVLLTLFIALVTSMVSGRHAAQLMPAKGVRHD